MNPVKKNLIDLFLSIDKLVYGLISVIYNLIMNVANYQIFSPTTIGDFSRRVYALIGIFMLFKITFSMIVYLVNPDEFADKSKGFGSLIKNVIISLVLIVAIPYIFEEATYLQNMVLNDGTIIKLVYGDGEEDLKLAQQDHGETISFILFSQFVRPNSSDIPELFVCEDIFDSDVGESVYYEEDETTHKKRRSINQFCEAELKNAFSKADLATYYIDAMELQDLDLLTSDSSIFTDTTKATKYSSSGDSKKYNAPVITYRFVLSTIAGLVIVSMFLTICLDVALRNIKLGFYQIIAPIPIISNCDPKSGKNGMLQKWSKACVSTYVDLFIRLLFFNIGMYLIINLFNDAKFDGFVSIVITIGVLMFAKAAPNIINDLTGLKIDKFTLNPFKKISNEALLPEKVGKAIGKIGIGNAIGWGINKGTNALKDIGGTAVRKTVAGIDAKSNGLSFKQGWGSIHSKGIGGMIKKFEETAPYTAATLKDRKKGQEEIEKMHTNWTKGREKANLLKPIAAKGKLYDNGIIRKYDDVFSVFDGRNDEAYQTVYKNDEFRNSRKQLDYADEKRKAYQRISDMLQMNGGDIDAAINSELKNNPNTFDSADKAKLESYAKSKDLNAFIKLRDNMAKEVQGKEKFHESIRKKYAADAATEDQIKFLKYNLDDPTSPGDASRHYDKTVVSVVAPTPTPAPANVGNANVSNATINNATVNNTTSAANQTVNPQQVVQNVSAGTVVNNTTSAASPTPSSTSGASTSASSTTTSAPTSSSNPTSNNVNADGDKAYAEGLQRDIELRNKEIQLQNKINNAKTIIAELKEKYKNEKYEVERRKIEEQIAKWNMELTALEEQLLDLIKQKNKTE